jgi:prophage regulatory protein
MQNLNLPETGFVKLQTILQFIPVSQTTWRQGVKDGVFPEAVKIGGKVTLWRVEDIKELISSYSNKEDNNPVNNKGGNSWDI